MKNLLNKLTLLALMATTPAHATSWKVQTDTDPFEDVDTHSLHAVDTTPEAFSALTVTMINDGPSKWEHTIIAVLDGCTIGNTLSIRIDKGKVSSLPIKTCRPLGSGRNMAIALSPNNNALPFLNAMAKGSNMIYRTPGGKTKNISLKGSSKAVQKFKKVVGKALTD
jgi:hypothetical protein